MLHPPPKARSLRDAKIRMAAMDFAGRHLSSRTSCRLDVVVTRSDEMSTCNVLISLMNVDEDVQNEVFSSCRDRDLERAAREFLVAKYGEEVVVAATDFRAAY